MPLNKELYYHILKNDKRIFKRILKYANFAQRANNNWKLKFYVIFYQFYKAL